MGSKLKPLETAVKGLELFDFIKKGKKLNETSLETFIISGNDK